MPPRTRATRSTTPAKAISKATTPKRASPVKASPVKASPAKASPLKASPAKEKEASAVQTAAFGVACMYEDLDWSKCLSDATYARQCFATLRKKYPEILDDCPSCPVAEASAVVAPPPPPPPPMVAIARGTKVVGGLFGDIAGGAARLKKVEPAGESAPAMPTVQIDASLEGKLAAAPKATAKDIAAMAAAKRAQMKPMPAMPAKQAEKKSPVLTEAQKAQRAREQRMAKK